MLPTVLMFLFNNTIWCDPPNVEALGQIVFVAPKVLSIYNVVNSSLELVVRTFSK